MLFLLEEVELKPTEMAIYNYINANLDKVIYMRIRELVDATYVSTTTILRFCKKFGCQGYADFKSQLYHYAKSIKENNTLIQSLDQTIFTEFLQRTTQPDFQRKLGQAIDFILQSELLFFVGIGTSGIMATYGANLFSSLYKFSLAVTDPQNSPVYYVSEQFDEHICLIVFSVSGQNEDVVDYINRFRLHHIKVISMTNSANSTIARISDLNIPYYINVETYQETNITSQLPVVYLLEYLAREVYYQKHKDM